MARRRLLHAIGDGWDRIGPEDGLTRVVVPTLRELIRAWNEWADEGTLLVRHEDVDVGTRNALNLHDGDGVSLTVADDAGAGEVDITVAWDGVTVRKNTGADVGTRRRLNLIEGAGVVLTVADDAGSDEVDVTIASSVSAYTDEQAQDAIGTILLDSATIDFTYDDATPSITAIVKPESITFATHIQNIASDRLLGRDTAGTGDVEELTVSNGISFTGSGGVQWDGVTVRKNTGADVGTRRRLNLIEGSNVTLTVTDDGAGGEVDVTVAASGGVTDHGALTGLADDDHAQYLLLAGRAGGQTAYGGTAASENLNLNATAHATKGTVTITGLYEKIAAGDSLWVDAANGNVLFGSSNPGNVGTLSGTNIVAIGANALGSATTAADIVAVGSGAAAAVSTVSGGGVYIGRGALATDTDPTDATIIGYYAVTSATTVSGVTAIGRSVLPYGGSSVIAVGTYTGYGANAATTDSVFIGNSIADTNTTPNDYVAAIGNLALKAANGATGTTAVGYSAGTNVTSGAYNLLGGRNAAPTLTTGQHNVVLGAYEGANTLANVPAAGSNNYIVLAGTDSIAVVDPTLGNVHMGGSKPGNWLTASGTNNVSVGDNALGSATTAADIVAVGSGAAAAVSTVSGGGVYIGRGALATDTDPTDATIIGYYAVTSATTVSGVTAIGRSVLPYGGSSVIAVGTYTGYGANAATTDSVFIGNSIADTNTTPNDYVAAVGNLALQDANGATGTSALGYSAGTNVTSGAYNTLIGFGVAPTLTIGKNNVVIGAYEDTATMADVTSFGVSGQIVIAAEDTVEGTPAQSLIAVGLESFYAGPYKPGNWKTSTGLGNVGIGRQALGGLTDGVQNTVIGWDAGGAVTSGDNNILLGSSAGVTLTTGNGNILVGNLADVPAAGTSNHLNIGGTVFGDLSGKDVRLGGSGAVSQTERLAITKANADSSEITSIETTGSNGAKSRTFVGTRNPDDTVSAAAGSLYVRVNGTSSALFVNTSSATGTTWSTVGAQLAYAPGSITIPAGHFRQHTRRIQMTGSQRLTAAGDARFSCYN